MVERHRGEKSYVRIARSSTEQNGYERHRTPRCPSQLLGPAHQAPETPPHSGDTKISKRRFGFKNGRKIFWAGQTEAARELRDGRQNRGSPPFFKGLPGDPLMDCQCSAG
jgi:hypothetical protein